MIHIEYSPTLITLTVFGEFTLADFDEFEQIFRYSTRFDGPIRLLFDLRQMDSFTFDVALQELNFTRQNHDQFERIAILTHDQWISWSAWISQIFTQTDTCVLDDEDEARQWLMQD